MLQLKRLDLIFPPLDNIRAPIDRMRLLTLSTKPKQNVKKYMKIIDY